MFNPLSSGMQMINKSITIISISFIFSLTGCAFPYWGGQQKNALASAQDTPSSTPRQESEILLNMGKKLMAEGQYHAAIPLLRSATMKGATSWSSLLYLARSLMAVGQYDEAGQILLSANLQAPQNPEILYSLGHLNLTLNRANLAEGYFEGALSEQAQNHRSLKTTTQAYSGLGVARALLGKQNAAIEAFDAGLVIDPNDLNLLSNKALALTLVGETNEAIEILEGIVKKTNAQSQHRQNLALAYVFKGDSERAWQMASIDMPSQMATQVVASFYNLKALEPQLRLKTLIYGMANPRSDIEEVANFKPQHIDGSAAAMRIGTSEVVEVAENEELLELPPLMDPEGWAVQIGAYRKAEEIIKGWSILRKRYHAIIGHLEPRRSEVQFGARDNAGPSGFFYRLNAGPLSGYRESRDICTALIRAGGDCWIRPPEPSEGTLPAQ